MEKSYCQKYKTHVIHIDITILTNIAINVPHKIHHTITNITSKIQN